MSEAAGGVPPVDPALLRQLLGRFPTGVAIITTLDANGQPAGLTCNSFSSVSLEPPLVLFSLRKASSSLGAFMAADAFAINLLTQQQDGLSGRFASSRIADKFEGVAWRSGELGMPALTGCMAVFACTVYARHEAGDHYVFLGEVKHMHAGPAGDALVFYKGKYMMLAESLRAMVAQDKLGPAQVDEAWRTLYGALLRLACERATPAQVDAVDAAIDDLERHVSPQALPLRVDAALRFFSAIADAAHNDALQLMAQTMVSILRERMMLAAPVQPRPDVLPLRREVARALRERDAARACAAMDHLIARLRDPA